MLNRTRESPLTKRAQNQDFTPGGELNIVTVCTGTSRTLKIPLDAELDGEQYNFVITVRHLISKKMTSKLTPKENHDAERRSQQCVASSCVFLPRLPSFFFLQARSSRRARCSRGDQRLNLYMSILLEMIQTKKIEGRDPRAESA
jgi:hypothetical protein